VDDDLWDLRSEVNDALASALVADIVEAIESSGHNDGVLAAVADFCESAGHSLLSYIDMSVFADRYVSAHAASVAAPDPEAAVYAIGSWPLYAATYLPMSNVERLDLVEAIVMRSPDLDESLAFVLSEGPLSAIGGTEDGLEFLQAQAQQRTWLAELKRVDEAARGSWEPPLPLDQLPPKVRTMREAEARLTALTGSEPWKVTDPTPEQSAAMEAYVTAMRELMSLGEPDTDDTGAP
jgi:hypothetical protein